jgi:hypothetical protein
MEGECYALIWGVMHFMQYLHRNYFMLQINHKPLEWLVIVLDVDSRRANGLIPYMISISKLFTKLDPNTPMWMH